MRRIMVALALAAVALSACGDDGQTASTDSGGDDSAPAAADNTLRITESDYAYAIEGELTAGTVSLSIENAGKELHEVGIVKLLDGKTLADAQAAMAAATPDTENPLEGIAEEDTKLDDLGGGQAPGTSYTITGEGIEAGEYAIACFIPNAEGKPHFQLGMTAGFTVAEGTSDAAVEADQTFTATDEKIDGPAEIPAGQTAIAVVNDSAVNREVLLLKLAAGKTMEDAGKFFESADQGPPDFANSPFEFFTFIFDAEMDRTITLDLTPGEWAIQSPDPENQFEGPPTEDPHAKLFTVV